MTTVPTVLFGANAYLIDGRKQRSGVICRCGGEMTVEPFIGLYPFRALVPFPQHHCAASETEQVEQCVLKLFHNYGTQQYRSCSTKQAVA